MSGDPTEAARRQMVADAALDAGVLVAENATVDELMEVLRTEYGKLWDTDSGGPNGRGIGEDFEVLGFMAPLVVVKGKHGTEFEGQKGVLRFNPHLHPRVYHSFEEA